MRNFKISTVRTYKTGEALECLNLVADSYVKVPDLPEKLGKRTKELQVAIEELDKVFNESTKEESTIKLIDLDKDRLSILQSMKLFARSMAKRSDPEKVKLGELLNNVLEHHVSGIYDESYPQKTALINSFLKDVKQNSLLTAGIETLGLRGEINELTKQNQTFSKLFDASAQEKKDPLNSFEKKEAARAIFVKLIEETEAFAIASDDSTVFEGLLKNTKKLLQKFDKPVLLRKRLRNKTNEVAEDLQPESLNDNASPVDME